MKNTLTNKDFETLPKDVESADDQKAYFDFITGDLCERYVNFNHVENEDADTFEKKNSQIKRFFENIVKYPQQLKDNIVSHFISSSSAWNGAEMIKKIRQNYGDECDIHHFNDPENYIRENKTNLLEEFHGKKPKNEKVRQLEKELENLQNDLINNETQIKQKQEQIKNAQESFQASLDEYYETISKHNFSPLKEKIEIMLDVRGDGDCFFRATLISSVMDMIIYRDVDHLFKVIFDIATCPFQAFSEKGPQQGEEDVRKKDDAMNKIFHQSEARQCKLGAIALLVRYYVIGVFGEDSPQSKRQRTIEELRKSKGSGEPQKIIGVEGIGDLAQFFNKCRCWNLVGIMALRQLSFVNNLRTFFSEVNANEKASMWFFLGENFHESLDYGRDASDTQVSFTNIKKNDVAGNVKVFLEGEYPIHVNKSAAHYHILISQELKGLKMFDAPKILDKKDPAKLICKDDLTVYDVLWKAEAQHPQPQKLSGDDVAKVNVAPQGKSDDVSQKKSDDVSQKKSDDVSHKNKVILPQQRVVLQQQQNNIKQGLYTVDGVGDGSKSNVKNIVDEPKINAQHVTHPPTHATKKKNQLTFIIKILFFITTFTLVCLAMYALGFS